MDFENKKQEIEAAFEAAADAARDFNEKLMAMRNIQLPNIEELSPEDRNKLIQMGRDLDMRSAFLLRSLLVSHGNVLFI
jgi:predicted kinase